MLASTTIKFAGGLSAKDAGVLKSEFRCSSELLLDQRKDKHQTEFACFVKNFTTQALSVTVPLGFVEDQPQITHEDYKALLEQNRDLYSEPRMAPEEIETKFTPNPDPPAERTSAQPQGPERETKNTEPESIPKPVQPKPPPKEYQQPGRGGKQHKYLQQLVKQLAEERGFRATIEETILDGAGRVDVSLSRDETRIACQVSVSTTNDWELSGIEKCLAAGYSEVVFVGRNERHVKSFAKFVENNLDSEDQGRVKYIAADGVMGYLDGLGGPTTRNNVVRGYKVRTTQSIADPDQAETRRSAISEVIAKSLLKGKE